MSNLYSKLFESSKLVNYYFCNAAIVYAILGKQDAMMAALTAAKTAASEQRNSMISYLESYKKDLNDLSKAKAGTSKIEVYLKRIAELIAEIKTKSWSMKDVFEAKTELGKYNQEYLKALNNFEPEIFQKEYPELFETSMIGHILIESGLLEIPDDALEITGKFGEVIDDLSSKGYSVVYPESALPYSREKIKDALGICIKSSKNEKASQFYKEGLFYLNFFIPDEELPDKNDREASLTKFMEIIKNIKH